MKRFEYKIEYPTFIANTIDEKHWLYFQGEDGWELCTITNHNTKYYFKREIEKDKENGL